MIDNNESEYDTPPENDEGSPLKINDSLTSAFKSKDVINIFSKCPSISKYPEIPVSLESNTH